MLNTRPPGRDKVSGTYKVKTTANLSIWKKELLTGPLRGRSRRLAGLPSAGLEPGWS